MEKPSRPFSSDILKQYQEFHEQQHRQQADANRTHDERCMKVQPVIECVGGIMQEVVQRLQEVVYNSNPTMVGTAVWREYDRKRIVLSGNKGDTQVRHSTSMTVFKDTIKAVADEKTGTLTIGVTHFKPTAKIKDWRVALEEVTPDGILEEIERCVVRIIERASTPDDQLPVAEPDPEKNIVDAV